MKTTIDVENKSERDAIRIGITEPDVRAYAIIIGALLALPSDRARQRVLSFVTDHLDEQRAQKQDGGP